MSDVYDLDDNSAPTAAQGDALAQVAAFLWKHWSSQPGKLAWFGGFFRSRWRADLAFPFASARLVEALTAGPTQAGQRAAAWGYGVVALAFVFYMARNTGVRFWIPFASNNMERSSPTASATCSASPPIGTPTISPARRCGACRGR
jgi:ATP-binding cassette, subfamily B, bacterial